MNTNIATRALLARVENAEKEIEIESSTREEELRV